MFGALWTVWWCWHFDCRQKCDSQELHRDGHLSYSETTHVHHEVPYSHIVFSCLVAHWWPTSYYPYDSGYHEIKEVHWSDLAENDFATRNNECANINPCNQCISMHHSQLFNTSPDTMQIRFILKKRLSQQLFEAPMTVTQLRLPWFSCPGTNPSQSPGKPRLDLQQFRMSQVSNWVPHCKSQGREADLFEVICSFIRCDVFFRTTIYYVI